MPQTFTVGSRSFFVDAMAWASIALALVLWCLIVAWAGGVLPAASPWQALLWAAAPGVLAIALVSAAGAGCAVGVLMRFDGARRIFIGLSVAWAFTVAVALWSQFALLRSLLRAALGESLPLGPGLLAAALAGLVTLLLAGGLAWVVQRLRSPMVRQEFA